MMRHIYSNLFVEYVAKNPALAPTEPFECAYAFDRALDAYASALVSPGTRVVRAQRSRAAFKP